MFVVSVLVCIQQSALRFKTRKKLASITALQMMDIGMTKERQQAELSQATLIGFVGDLLTFMKNKG
ncbi:MULTISPECIES: hypothetical protein [Marinomonas]|uniref:Uncharacterized protein n=1 Tax=Marinomonas rhodophyticola TaxID=2992803 RepID=A0ABT3KB69_9GAMM|nr:hypothetical protein [Marinomonas sp. KJ51-3]MCW4627780.1 hypothetical protein [Marinomonas sp. KJ51-3]